MKEALQRINGLFVGQLSDDEMELFTWAIKHGKARRVYKGGMGFLGCALVEVC